MCVVTVHAFPDFGDAFNGQGFEPNFLSVFTSFIGGFFRGQSVPIYFFISGFVFFINFELTKESYFRKLKNRVKTLLIPYIIWNALPIILLVSKSFFASSDIDNWGLHPTLTNFLSCFWDYNGELDASSGASTVSAHYPMNVPLWFLKDLMFVVLFTPLIYWVLKRTKYFVITILGILWFADQCIDLNIDGQFHISSFFFFSLGAYMSINRKDMLVEFGRVFHLSMVLYPLLGIVYIFSRFYFPEYSTIIITIKIFSGLLFAYNLAAWLLKKNICKVSTTLASASFFIYVSHALVINCIQKILYRIFMPPHYTLPYEIAFVCINAITVVMTILLLFAVFLLLRKYFPAMLKVLTGRK